MSPSSQQNFPEGFRHYPLYFSPSQQQDLIEAVKQGVAAAPFFQPTMPRTGAPALCRDEQFWAAGLGDG